MISDTDNHVALSRYPQTFPCPRLCLAASSSLPLPLQFSQAKGCSRRCHMMSCGPVVVAEQWQFYPCAIWSTRHPLVTCAHAACSSVCVRVCVSIIVWPLIGSSTVPAFSHVLLLMSPVYCTKAALSTLEMPPPTSVKWWLSLFWSVYLK